MKNNSFKAVLTVFFAVAPVVVCLIILTVIFGGYGAIFGAVSLACYIVDHTTTEPETTEPNQE